MTEMNAALLAEQAALDMVSAMYLRPLIRSMPPIAAEIEGAAHAPARLDGFGQHGNLNGETVALQTKAGKHSRETVESRGMRS